MCGCGFVWWYGEGGVWIENLNQIGPPALAKRERHGSSFFHIYVCFLCAVFKAQTKFGNKQTRRNYNKPIKKSPYTLLLFYV